MTDRTREIAREILESYDSNAVEKIERDNEGAVVFDSTIVRGFPLYPVSGRFGPDHYHSNPWINGNRESLGVLNGQEANTSKVLYVFDQAKGILEQLRKYSEGEGHFTTDTPDNGFITVFRDNYEGLTTTLEKLSKGAGRQSKSKIKRLADLIIREGAYWTNLPAEVSRAGEIFSEINQNYISARGKEFRISSVDYLTQNPEAFKTYFTCLTDFVRGNSKLFRDIKDRSLDLPLMVSVQEEEKLSPGDYVQGEFFVPGEGWKMLDGEFVGLTELEVENKKRKAIQLDNSSDEGDGAGLEEVIAISDITKLGNPVWRLK